MKLTTLTISFNVFKLTLISFEASSSLWEISLQGQRLRYGYPLWHVHHSNICRYVFPNIGYMTSLITISKFSKISLTVRPLKCSQNNNSSYSSSNMGTLIKLKAVLLISSKIFSELIFNIWDNLVIQMCGVLYFLSLPTVHLWKYDGLYRIKC